MAKAFADGMTDHEIFKLSVALRISPGNLEAIKRDKRFIKDVEKQVRSHALYATARNLPFMEKLAQKNVGAFTALAKIAGAWPGSEVNINTQVNVGDRSGDNESDRAFHIAFQQRLRSGLVQRLILLEGGKVEHDPPVPFPDPDPDDPTVEVPEPAEPESGD